MGYFYKFIQIQLNKFNAGLSVDGVLGDKTLFWVRGIQNAGGLTIDGIYGAKTHKYAMSVVNSRSKSTKHFSQKEFNCKHCGKNIGIHINLLVFLEALRCKLKQPIVVITSGYRCITHNRAVGSKDTSQHVKANAADIVVRGVSAYQVYTTGSRYNVKGGCGKYIKSAFTHFDCRGVYARWSG